MVLSLHKPAQSMNGLSLKKAVQALLYTSTHRSNIWQCSSGAAKSENFFQNRNGISLIDYLLHIYCRRKLNGALMSGVELHVNTVEILISRVLYYIAIRLKLSCIAGMLKLYITLDLVIVK